MIKLNQLQIKEFRGIRDFEFNFDRNNFVIYGPNGSGKSGVIDAIEFGLTGKISRLSGAGTGNLSLKKHGPHVDCKNNELSSVLISFYIPSLDKNVSLFRRVADADNPVVSPDEPDVFSIVKQIESRPEFCLSRRQLIKFVLARPVDRAQYVQTLLQLDKIDLLRLSLNRIVNDTKKDTENLERQKNDIKQRLMQHFDGQPVSAQSVLDSSNRRRISLCLPELKCLEATTSIKDGLSDLPWKIARKDIVKSLAESESRDILQKLNSINSTENGKTFSDVSRLLDDLMANEKDLKQLRVDDFLQTALDLFDGKSCPVCGTSFDVESFLSIVQPKKEYYQYLAKSKQQLSSYLDKVRQIVEPIIASVKPVEKYGQMLKPTVDVSKLSQLLKVANILKESLSYLFPLEEKKIKIDNFITACLEAKETVGFLQEGISRLPNPNEQESARDFLNIGQMHIDAFREICKKIKVSQEKNAVANKIYAVYNDITTQTLNQIYDNIESDFINFYKFINQDDESAFDAKLIPKKGGLEISVDFYGRGFYPPGALHSEGHQDGMGLCLYLALMRYLFADNFTLAILDDVLMSVDTGHRRQFSRLLKDFFSSTQFIITTHDKTWFNHLRNDGLIPQRGFVDFRSWSVEVGPTTWQGRDVWHEINTLLCENNIHYASSLLRRYLEHIFEDICHRLRAPVPYRSDARYTLGDFLPNGYSCLKKILKKGKDAGNSFGNSSVIEFLNAWDEKLSKAYQLTRVDEWQLNSAVHYTNWENFHKNEFSSLVESYKNLVDCFRCDKCFNFINLTYNNMVASYLDCSCGNVSVKLIPKK